MAGYYNAKSRQQLLHLPAVWLIKLIIYLHTKMSPRQYVRVGGKAECKETLLAAHTSKSAPFPAVQIPMKMWEAHLQLNLPYLMHSIRFCCATLCYITSHLI